MLVSTEGQTVLTQTIEARRTALFAAIA